MRAASAFASAVLAIAATVGAPTARAQGSRDVGLDLVLGGGNATGGTYADRSAVSIDVLLSDRLRQLGHGGLVGAVSGDAQGALGHGDVCLLLPGGGCAPEFPAMGSVTALGGWESRSAGEASARVLAGPGFYWGGGSRTVGLQTRLDLVTPSLGPVALVASGRTALLPRFHGDGIRVWAIGFGLRFR